MVIRDRPVRSAIVSVASKSEAPSTMVASIEVDRTLPMLLLYCGEHAPGSLIYIVNSLVIQLLTTGGQNHLTFRVCPQTRVGVSFNRKSPNTLRAESNQD